MRWSAIRDGASATLGTVLAIIPHVMHHIGLLAGTALIAGAGGNLLFYAIGLVFSIPLLRRLYRRFHGWLAPAIGIAVFTGLFSVSAFVIGPAISDRGSSDQEPTPSPVPTESHAEHHP